MEWYNTSIQDVFRGTAVITKTFTVGVTVDGVRRGIEVNSCVLEEMFRCFECNHDVVTLLLDINLMLNNHFSHI